MKRTNMLRLAAGVWCMMAVLACNQHAPKDEALFQSINVAEQVHLTADTLSPSCSMRIDLDYMEGDDSVCYLINKEIVKAVFKFENLSPKEAVDSFIANYTHSYTHDLLPYYMEDKDAGREPLNWYSYYYDVKTRAQNGKEGLLNYVIETNTYEGGAHGNQVNTYLNFYADSGKLVSLDDLFVPGYEASLNEILLNALMNLSETTSMEDLQEKGYLLWTSMYPSKNFLLKTDCIEFLYNAYEIAPYALGVTVLKIPYSDLVDILKK